MNRHHDLLPISLLLLALVLTAWLGLWGPLFAESGAEGWLFRWKELVGSVLGAAGTIFAGWLAWRGIRRQISHADDQRRLRQDEAKRLVIFGMTKAVHAAAVTLAALRVVRDMPFENRVDRFLLNFRVLIGVVNTIGVRASLAEMPARDSLHATMIISSLDSAIAVYNANQNENIMVRIDQIEPHLSVLTGYLESFDADLAETFKRDSAVPTA